MNYEDIASKKDMNPERQMGKRAIVGLDFAAGSAGPKVGIKAVSTRSSLWVFLSHGILEAENFAAEEDINIFPIHPTLSFTFTLRLEHLF